MMEIVFSDSACGSLKIAQHYGEGEYCKGCIGVIISHSDGSKPTKEEIENAQREAEEKACLSWEEGVPLGGNSADVYGLNLALSVGDISENEFYNKRQSVLENLYDIILGGQRVAQKLLKNAAADMRKICDRAAAGEDIRIWYSNQPDELCGLYWFMNKLCTLQACKNRINLVMLPNLLVDEKGDAIRRVNGWGQVEPGEWHKYLDFQTCASPELCQYYALCWRKLQSENAPLRAMLNGTLVSMPETLYDDFIIREIAEEKEEFQEALVIGRVLGKYQLGISDAWIALRIEEMISKGKLEVVSKATEAMPSYHRLLHKCTDR